MAVLVTGGAGYIGSHMVLALRDRGEDVVVLDNLSTGHEWAVPRGVPLAVGNAGDENLVARLIRQHGIDAIAHFAGSIVVPDSVRDPLFYYQNNTAASRALIAAAVRAGVETFIFSSTAAVYGAPETNPVAEDAPLRPISPYGSSKLMTETMLRDTAFAHDLRFTALRYFNVAGADPKGRSGQSTPRATHLIKVAVQTALGDRPCLEVFGTDYDTADGTCIRDYIHVEDLADAHIAALEADKGLSGCYNLGTGRGHSVREVIDTARRVTGREIPEVVSPRRAGDPPELVADSALVQSKLGWRPRHDLESAIRSAWTFKQNS